MVLVKVPRVNVAVLLKEKKVVEKVKKNIVKKVVKKKVVKAPKPLKKKRI